MVRVLGEREIDRPAAVAVLRRRLAEPRRRATLQPARQEPSLDDAPGVVVGDAREIARPRAHVPDAVQARVAAAERTAHRLRRMDADVADLDRAQFDHRAGRLQLDAYVPLLPLHKRRDVDSRARDCVRLVAVHVRGEDGVVEERPEVVDAVAAREAARRREAVRVCRIGEPQDGVADHVAVRVAPLRAEGLHLDDGVAAHGLPAVVERHHGLFTAERPVEPRRCRPALRVQHLLRETLLRLQSAARHDGTWQRHGHAADQSRHEASNAAAQARGPPVSVPFHVPTAPFNSIAVSRMPHWQ